MTSFRVSSGPRNPSNDLNLHSMSVVLSRMGFPRRSISATLIPLMSTKESISDGELMHVVNPFEPLVRPLMKSIDWCNRVGFSKSFEWDFSFSLVTNQHPKMTVSDSP